jgi:hypothetical protein
MIWVIVFLNFAPRLDRFHLNPAQKVALRGTTQPCPPYQSRGMPMILQKPK